MKTIKWTDLQWERIEILDKMPDEYQSDWLVEAEYNGVTYQGIGTYSCGELIEVENIEKI